MVHRDLLQPQKAAFHHRVQGDWSAEYQRYIESGNEVAYTG
ncbi:hypothetical protein HMPREF1248_0986 [Coriobacteriaceae bacterium BV3Ac1]|nr:hypothetical protein HMPREF1248_0986 [Coriobacteriaceae bacterium BV3Ac1]